MTIKFIYVRGGEPKAAEIATRARVGYGIRHDYKAYGNVDMLDINWKRYKWANYLEKVAQHNPELAMCPDFEHIEQTENLNRQIDDLRPMVNRVMVCPKFPEALHHIPQDCLIGLSVPAPNYAGYIPPLNLLNGRKVHLLGGDPRTQYDLIKKINAEGGIVESADGNILGLKAEHGQFFKWGSWMKTRPRTVPTIELAIASAANIQEYLNDAIHYKQPCLLGA